MAGTGEGGDDVVFEPVIKDILDELNGKPLDLYVMTHEHLDHVQGMFFASNKLPQLDFDNRFKVDHVWLTASAHPDYYDTHPEAKKQKVAFDAMYARLSAFLTLHPAAASHGVLEILANNDPTKTGQCVEFLRKLNPAKSTYLFRGAPLDGTHPFREAQVLHPGAGRRYQRLLWSLRAARCRRRAASCCGGRCCCAEQRSHTHSSRWRGRRRIHAPDRVAP